MPYEIEFVNRQTAISCDEEEILRAASAVLAGEQIASAEISLCVVDDGAIHELNRQYLQHDYPTDVISFILSHEQGHLDGEVIASAETAERESKRLGWATEAELLLYLVHGLLHLCGYDDRDPAALARMREKERHYLSLLGHTARYDEPA